MNLSKELAKQAAKFGICQDWHTELKSLEDKKALIKMYLKGIDFCLSYDYPNNEFIRKHFKGVMGEFGVFLDDSIDLVNVPKCVALGKTKGSVETTDFGTSEIFVKHDSELTIIAEGDSFVMVDVFDNAVIHIQAYDRAKVCVNRYGNSIIDLKESDSGMVKVIEKHKKSY